MHGNWVENGRDFFIFSGARVEEHGPSAGVGAAAAFQVRFEDMRKKSTAKVMVNLPARSSISYFAKAKFSRKAILDYEASLFSSHRKDNVVKKKPS
jgi:hypothetical protein